MFLAKDVTVLFKKWKLSDIIFVNEHKTTKKKQPGDKCHPTLADGHKKHCCFSLMQFDTGTVKKEEFKLLFRGAIVGSNLQMELWKLIMEVTLTLSKNKKVGLLVSSYTVE